MKNRKRSRSQIKRSAPLPRIQEHAGPASKKPEQQDRPKLEASGPQHDLLKPPSDRPPGPPKIDLLIPEKPEPEDAAQLARIDQISMVARTTWFGLLAYLAFVGVTLLGVEDADFFVPSRQTQLPLVNVSIPTSSFFWFAPMLGAALYAYLHLQLLKLWEALAAPPPKINGKHLSELVYPWLISDYAILLRDRNRNDGSMRPRPLAWLSHLATWILVWAAGPAVLIGFWLVSMPAHNVLMTITISACVLVGLYLGVSSHWTLLERISHPNGNPRIWARHERQGRGGTVVIWVLVASLTMTVGIPGVPGTPEPADLRGIELVAKPADWRDYRTARRRFRATWCKRQGLEAEICRSLYSASSPEPSHVTRLRKEWCQTKPRGIDDCPAHFADLDKEFSTEWREEWASKIDALETLDLRGKDFRNADMAFAFIAGADFRGARMEGANLIEARMEGAILHSANLKSAALTETFADISVRAADLRSADVTQQMLNNVFGDVATIIPDGLVRPDHWDEETIEFWKKDPKFEAWLRGRQAAKKQEATTNGN